MPAFSDYSGAYAWRIGAYAESPNPPGPSGSAALNESAACSSATAQNNRLTLDAGIGFTLQ